MKVTIAIERWESGWGSVDQADSAELTIDTDLAHPGYPGVVLTIGGASYIVPTCELIVLGAAMGEHQSLIRAQRESFDRSHPYMQHVQQTL